MSRLYKTYTSNIKKFLERKKASRTDNAAGLNLEAEVKQVQGFTLPHVFISKMYMVNVWKYFARVLLFW